MFICMNIWMIGKKNNKISLPKTEDFYSHLNIEDITDLITQKGFPNILK